MCFMYITAKLFKMEVLHHSDIETKSAQISQDSPVDLRTSGNLNSPSMLHQMMYTHPQNLITDRQNQQVIDPFKLILSERVYSKEMKESKNKLGVKLESYSSSSECKNISKRKRQGDDCPEVESVAIKRQKIDDEKFIAKNNEFHSNKELPGTLKHNVESYSPFQYAQQCMPFTNKDYTDLLDRLKSSHSSNLSTTFVKETESLLAAVHHSQMLYYSYCSKLLHNLQTRKYIEEQERTYKYISKSSNKETESLPNNATENKTNKMNKSSSKARFNTSKKVSKSLPKYKSSFENKNENSLIMPIHYHSSTSDKNSTTKDKPATCVLQKDKREVESLQDNSQTSREREEQKDLTARKRTSRALTGKHVRHGTGASLSTLRTLRQKLQERQRIRRAHSLSNDREVRTFLN
ncbi:hypothetical protein Avbf_12317 [Armadillidium vulgare]|nr:hypothetical protein Avbf_12317 [Armadillidium vulgare]